MKTVCIISLSVIKKDGRVLRQVDYLSKKYRVHVIGYGPAPKKYNGMLNITWHELPSEHLGLPLWILRVFTRLIQAPFFPRSQRVFRIAHQLKCDVYHANNWDSLPFAAMAAKQNGAKLVLDIHESYDAWYWGWITPITKYILRKYSKQVDFSTTVGKTFAEQNKDFGLDASVVLNTPDTSGAVITSRKTEKTAIQLVYHGPAIPTRTSDLMIKAVALSERRYKLRLILTNPGTKYVRYLENFAEQIAPGRVTFHPPVAPLDIVSEISQYDVGFFPLPPKNYNYLLALPNKLFEFIAAGLAVCIGPSLSMAEIVREYDCGVIAPSFTPDDIAKLLNNTSAEQWNDMKEASVKAAKVLNAENEMGKVLELYRNLFLEDPKSS
jgi:glycosyltransferase involved in cell wall biosynthesis